MKPRLEALTHLKLFPGSFRFRQVLEERHPLVPKPEIDKFFSSLESVFSRLQKSYFDALVRSITDAPKSPAANGSTIATYQSSALLALATDLTFLSSAIGRLESEPFSQVVSQFVHITTGEPTQLGRRLLNSEIAGKINSPKSRLIRLMHSLELSHGVSFADLVVCSYVAFNYARSGITTSTAPAEPLYWLPFGNSVFLAKLAEYRKRSETTPVTIVNLGAGPGALESMVLSNRAVLPRNLKIVSVDFDPTALKILREKRTSTDLEWTIIEGDFTKPKVQAAISEQIRGIPLVVAGYSMHHICPGLIDQVMHFVLSLIEDRGYAQIHDVGGGVSGGGQSPVNTLFFNFLTLYHLSTFYSDLKFLNFGLRKMEPESGSAITCMNRNLFLPQTGPEEAKSMLTTQSISIFTRESP